MLIILMLSNILLHIIPKDNGGSHKVVFYSLLNPCNLWYLESEYGH
jgi:5-methylcytosine-specific restriction endonuclease McrA